MMGKATMLGLTGDGTEIPVLGGPWVIHVRERAGKMVSRFCDHDFAVVGMYLLAAAA
jgi:hypothetical protein